MVLGWTGWTLLYGVLLLFALFTGGGIGGPLAYPAGMIAIGLAGVGIGWGMFAPACGVGAWVCTRLRWPGIAAIPIVFLVFALLFAVVCRGVTGAVSLKALAFLSFPLGAYWWLTEGPGLIASLVVFRRGAEAAPKSPGSRGGVSSGTISRYGA